jgi:ribosome-binding protein aMBF1 (putative translation factor)
MEEPLLRCKKSEFSRILHMKKPTTFEELFERAKQHIDFHVYGVIWQFTEAVVERMQAQGVSKSNLATMLGCKPAYITKVLRGNTNFTFESMVKIAHALGTQVKVELVPVKSEMTIRPTIHTNVVITLGTHIDTGLSFLNIGTEYNLDAEITTTHSSEEFNDVAIAA